MGRTTNNKAKIKQTNKQHEKNKGKRHCRDSNTRSRKTQKKKPLPGFEHESNTTDALAGGLPRKEDPGLLLSEGWVDHLPFRAVMDPRITFSSCRVSH